MSIVPVLLGRLRALDISLPVFAIVSHDGAMKERAPRLSPSCREGSPCLLPVDPSACRVGTIAQRIADNAAMHHAERA